MTQIDHIVFDIGKVLIHYDPELPYRDLIPDATERRWFLDNVTTGDWNIEQDRGRSWEEAETLLIADHPDHAENIRAFRQHWHKMVPHAYDDSVAIFEGLIEEGRDVTMLTNFAADTFSEAQERFAFLKKPRGVTVSGHHRLLKPDVAIYELHACTFGLDPAATLFIDDSAKNVEGAKGAGWQAVQFTNAERLERDLKGLGIL
ncbi:HAD-IA family hydrolase [Aliihoeflea aestuarii]|uniref:HAD family hydrolase n=1 Tax=Aliihoeflea aestuarii TaxID=453840 RepID=UPI0020942B3F|nr:HAD family phosphatase [Aliihoeflea aestuarii]MCO6392126.1 HAD-IA family hydrolase [Aliihoeflea aestuarii]